ncbi:MAG: hypothetical protein ACKORJ_02650 [Bacteroidota bacterium]
MNLNRTMVAALALLSGLLIAQPQEPNSDALEQRNAFKTIRLNYPVDSIRGAKFKKKSHELKTIETEVYEVTDPELETIGEVKVHGITVRTFNRLVYRIEVVTEKDPRLMKGLEKAYGKPSYSVRSGIYSWRAPSVSLTFAQHDRNEFILTYNSYTVFKMIHEAKGGKVTEIADEL